MIGIVSDIDFWVMVNLCFGYFVWCIVNLLIWYYNVYFVLLGLEFI